MTGNTYLSQLKILYVEDDDCTRQELEHYLRKKAGKVITASDGEEGLKKYSEEDPDIVIADILLPRMNGIDMLKQIRKLGGRCPFIITSSVHETEMIIEAVDTGIVKYVVKPIILAQLLDALNKLAATLRSGNVIFGNVEKKLEFESKIKQAMTAFLKRTAGKGPRDMTVFISDEQIQISAYGMITPLERKLLEDKHNVSIIEHIHKSYYKTVKPEMEFMVKEIIGIDVILSHTDFAVFKSMDHLIFEIDGK